MRTRRTSSSSDPVSPEGHRTVLLRESIESLDIQGDDIVVDATLGGAGHSRAIAEKLGREGTLIAFDLDADALGRGEEALRGARCTVRLVEANFRDIETEAEKLRIDRVSKALFDLGWSSYQLDVGRGFSFLADEPLRMTYSKRANALTARTIVNEWSEASLADILWGFGGERYARRIAAAIVERRSHGVIETSRQLAELVKDSVPHSYRTGRTHPATKTFQALRIAVNDELGALEKALAGTWKLLVPGGRIAVITFHSLEDRFVKQTFAAWEKEGVAKRLTKKPIVPGAEERSANPRARSAKLRVIQKNL